MKDTNGPWKIVPDNGQWTVVPDAEYLRDIEHRLTRLEIMLYISIMTSALSFVGIHIFDTYSLLRGILP
jgi:cell division protein FtsL